MNKIILLTILSLTVVACSKQDKPYNSANNSSNNYNNTTNSMMRDQDADNTGRNVRDRDSMTLTPMDQSETEADRTITQRIRKAIMADSALSTDAKNIKIITIKGVVTLRGPVLSAQEKEAIARKVNDVQGIQKVDNQLEVIRR